MTNRPRTDDRPPAGGPARADRPATGPVLADVALQPPLRVGRGTTLREVAAAMEDAQVSCVLVGTGPPWVVTEHDLAGALAAGCGPDIPVDQVATRTPEWATVTSTVAEAIELMVHHGIRHLLVLTADGTLRGILGLADATRALLAA